MVTFYKKIAMNPRIFRCIRSNISFFIYICTLNNIIFNYYGT